MRKTYCIIGTSAAGIGAAYRLRLLDSTSRIICISDEKEIPYNKCFIVDYLSGERTQEQVLTLTQKRAKEKNIELILGIRVIKLLPERKNIELSDGSTLSYDALLLGTGRSPIIPSIQGIEGARGVFTFYTLQDVNVLDQYIQKYKPKTVVVIGAGLSGLEAADGLHARGLQVHVVERAAHVLPQQVDIEGAQLIAHYMQKAGVTLHADSIVQEIKQKNNVVSGVQLADGKILPADMVVCAVGARPNSQLAQEAGIQTKDGYIVVDEAMRTNLLDIYAAGDVVCVKDRITGSITPSCTWPDAMQQGMVAAYNMTGQKKKYTGAVPITSSAFFGVKFATYSPVTGGEFSGQKTIKKGDGWYHLLLEDKKQLKGFVLVGNMTEFTQVRRRLLTQSL